MSDLDAATFLVQLALNRNVTCSNPDPTAYVPENLKVSPRSDHHQSLDIVRPFWSASFSGRIEAVWGLSVLNHRLLHIISLLSYSSPKVNKFICRASFHLPLIAFSLVHTFLQLSSGVGFVSLVVSLPD